MAKKRIPKTRAKYIRRRLRRDELKNPVKVTGEINFSNDPTVTHISANLHSCEKLTLAGCENLKSLPADLRVEQLDISGCVSLRKLPSRLHATRIHATNSGLRGMAATVRVSEAFILSGSHYLKRLATNLNVKHLHLDNCTALTRLPDKLSVGRLDMTGCTAFTTWGNNGTLLDIDTSRNDSHAWWINRSAGRTVILNGCSNITYLPDWMRSLHYLDIRNCARLMQLPETLRYVQHFEIGDSGLRYRPPNLRYEKLYWHGVEINDRIAWQPDKIKVKDVWDERNLEVRRVMIDRMGYNKFFREADAELLDLDMDAGGERSLLRVKLPDSGNRWNRDEPIVCLAVSCPSTAHRYVLRVPPHISSCHAGAAWLAGFDDPKLYAPVKET
ncbi:MAG: DUF6745 domain-containing protein [Chloroflexota bacterium]